MTWASRRSSASGHALADTDAQAQGDAEPRAESLNDDATDNRMKWLVREILPHQKWLQNLIARRFPRQRDVDDIVQESLERIMTVHDPWSIGNPRAYLGRTAITVILGRLRREKVARIEHHDDLEALGFQCELPLQDRILEDREMLSRVEKALAELPERTQEVVRLRRFENTSLRATAERLGLSQSSIEKHLRRAMAHARSAIDQHGECPDTQGD
ncbi:MAG: RNA polymerase sigma factor [Sphingorhabdus sp.]